jgi:poly-gamma-glutamate capsule biosynthesis protein CapA/YwtB (metallophosphatase superfamily)
MRLLTPLVLAAFMAFPGAGVAAPAPNVGTVRLILSGDVMLGRGVAGLARARPAAVFGGIAPELHAADLAVANLESPLTNRPHLASHGPNALEAKPWSARLLRAAGFDAMAIANNHAGDAGPVTTSDTTRALAAAGLGAIGASFTPVVLRVHGLRIAFLSFDDTGEGPRPGVAWWDPTLARAAVERARAVSDVVVVGLHGGSDYNPTTDPWLLRLGRLLAAWGADVVWGTGPHVVQPTELVPGRAGRTTLVTTSLGNLLFDQHIPGTRTGELLEVLLGKSGVRAYRLGTTAQEPSNAVQFGRWKAPRGDAADLAGEWWSLAGTVRPASLMSPPTLSRFPGKVVAASLGDPFGNRGRQLVISFWRPYRRTDVNALIPRKLLVDRRGLTAHVGIYTSDTRRELWVAGTLLRPVAHLAACDGSLAVAYTALNGSAVTDTGAWQWRGFGFSLLPMLGGAGRPGCADIDGDGRLDPVILGRTR